MNDVGKRVLGCEERLHCASAHAPVLRFLLMFALYLGVGNLLLSLSWVDVGLVEPWTNFNATAAAALSRMIGIEAQANGMHLSYGYGSLNILTGCNGVEAVLILTSALLALPSSWTERLTGVLAGTIAIFGANLLRLVSLLLIARYLPEWLEFVHVYVWQALIVVLAFGLFLSWGTVFAHVRAAITPSHHA